VHAVLNELVRVFGHLRQHGWRPGRTVIFASWDGEEAGQLGSTSWMNQHAKELESRAVAYLNLDYGSSNSRAQVEGGALFKDLVQLAAKSVACDDQHGLDDCSLYEMWSRAPSTLNPKSEETSTPPDSGWRLQPSASPWQTLLGVSTLHVFLENLSQGNTMLAMTKRSPLAAMAPESVATPASVVSTAMAMLDEQFRYSSIAARFATILIMQLATSKDLPLSALAYADRISQDLDAFMSLNGDKLKDAGVPTAGMKTAAAKLAEASQHFKESFHKLVGSGLTFLASHEANDALMEMERAMLTHIWTSTDQNDCMNFTQPARHAVYGPSPLNAADIGLFPRLQASISAAEIAHSDRSSECLAKEVFFASDALKSASKVLRNDLLKESTMQKDLH